MRTKYLQFVAVSTEQNISRVCLKGENIEVGDRERLNYFVVFVYF